MSEFVQITTTGDKKEILQELARELVRRRLAACVQISGPVESVYSWQGELESTPEWRCTIKTLARHQSSIESAVREIHNYETPELITVTICNGSQDYLDWVRTQTTPE